MYQPSPLAFEKSSEIDFELELAFELDACGGLRCHSCPFFNGTQSRDGKSCASCPWRLFSIARRAAGVIGVSVKMVYDRVTGHISAGEPSDGHPQEEKVPDFGWFRPLSFNNPTWTLFWPELLI